MRKVIAVCLLSILVFASTASAQEKPKFEIENGRLKLTQPITFVTDSDKLTPESDAALSHIKAFLEDKTYITLLRIEGHTDNQGQAAASQSLTEKRALAVARWLVAHGIDCKRLIAVGFGATKPVAANDSPAGRAQNRRIEIAMAELRGKAIGGMPADGGGKVAETTCSELDFIQSGCVTDRGSQSLE